VAGGVRKSRSAAPPPGTDARLVERPPVLLGVLGGDRDLIVDCGGTLEVGGEPGVTRYPQVVASVGSALFTGGVSSA
jgi:hypothetical protein